MGKIRKQSRMDVLSWTRGTRGYPTSQDTHDTYFKVKGFGPRPLNEYIKQQRAARMHKIKVTLAKKWEG